MSLAVEGGIGSPVEGGGVLEEPTVIVMVTVPYAPVESHARTKTVCLPVVILTGALMVWVLVAVCQAALLSTYTYQPVIALPDEAEAAMVEGEETVDPAKGDETLTVTLADATTVASDSNTNSERMRKDFPSWSSMGAKSSRATHIPNST